MGNTNDEITGSGTNAQVEGTGEVKGGTDEQLLLEAPGVNNDGVSAPAGSDPTAVQAEVGD